MVSEMFGVHPTLVYSLIAQGPLVWLGVVTRIFRVLWLVLFVPAQCLYAWSLTFDSADFLLEVVAAVIACCSVSSFVNASKEFWLVRPHLRSGLVGILSRSKWAFMIASHPYPKVVWIG